MERIDQVADRLPGVFLELMRRLHEHFVALDRQVSELEGQIKQWHRNCELSLGRRNPNIAAVALANKNARTVWALLAHDREFRADYVPKLATA